jgi:acetate kinase
MDTILVVNAGSSSVKFQVFDIGDATGLKCLIKGQMDGIGTRPKFRARDTDGRPLADQTYSAEKVSDLPAAMREAGAWLRGKLSAHPVAVGHRVAHGGPAFDRPVLINKDVIARLEEYVCLAPLHQPNNLAPIRALTAQMPEVTQIACFDTAFHRKHDPVVDHFAIPERFYAEGVRRYGFHGLSYEYLADRLRQVAPDIADRRVIVAHLGSGASMCALANGRSIETTMGFSALDGLPMGTRSGQIDPGVILYLIGQKRMSPDDVQDLLYKESGLKGLSGVSNDVRELTESKDPRATFAIDYFVYRAGLHAGMLAAALGGIDALVFTAGIGENSPLIRARIAEKLAWMGVTLDAAANSARAPVISAPGSRVAVLVVPTDEEMMIARHTVSLLSKPRTQAAS